MKSRYVLTMAVVLGTAGVSVAQAADLQVDLPRPIFSRASCSALAASRFAGLPIEVIRNEVLFRYVNSVEESESHRTVFSRSPRVVWAFASRQACGIALGYLSTGEINFERLWNCDCYHARMLSFLPRR